MREKTDGALERQRACEGRVHAHIRSCVNDSHAIGANHAHAVLANLREDVIFQFFPARARLGESRRNEDNRFDFLATAVVDGLRDKLFRHTNDRELDAVGDFEDAAVTLHRMNYAGIRIDREDHAVEFVLDEVVQDFAADGHARAASTDDRDGSRLEDGLDTRALDFFGWCGFCGVFFVQGFCIVFHFIYVLAGRVSQ